MHRLFCAALAAAVFVLLGAPAQASGYVSAYGGVAFGDGFAGEGDKASFAAAPDAAGVAGLAVGTAFSDLPLRAEIEASWRHARLGGVWEVCGPPLALDASDETFAATLNLAYELKRGPYAAHALAGAGFGSRRIVLEPTPDNWQNTSSGANEHGFVWQLGAGASYALSDRASAGIAYRYFVGPSIDRVAIVDGKSTFFEAAGDSHAIVATLAYAFD